jgi:hypothetical protein
MALFFNHKLTQYQADIELQKSEGDVQCIYIDKIHSLISGKEVKITKALKASALKTFKFVMGWPDSKKVVVVPERINK